MKLYMVPVAPNPTRVLLYIAEREELGVKMNIETVMVNTLKGEQRGPEHLARNPFGTVPVLELPDGTHLIESLAIIQYLDQKFAGPSLFGDNIEQRGRVLDLERTVEMRLALPMMHYVHATNSPLGWAPDPEAAARIRTEAPAAFDYVTRLLADGRPWLAGDTVTMADCTLQAACQFMRFGKGDLLDDQPAVLEWDARYRARPAAQRVLKL